MSLELRRHHVTPELGEYVISEMRTMASDARVDELNRLLTAIKLAAKVIHREINKAGLADILGTSGSSNIQGEVQQKLDVFAQDNFVRALRNREVVAGICSEEEEDIVFANDDAGYVICMDPLDGSSNIDVNAAVGTIFCVYRRKSPVGKPCTEADFLQKGRDAVLAGYVVYGSSTILVISFGKGVHGFTLDVSLGSFFMSHPHMRFPKGGNTLSINIGNELSFTPGVRKYTEWCKGAEEPTTVSETSRPYTLRYIGSFVADFHRNVIQGGIYLYPATKKNKNGKLRLLYECIPIAFLAERAGGAASDGRQPILDIQPSKLHQRCPMIVGPTHMVDKALEFIRDFESA